MGHFVRVPTALLDAVADSDSDLDGLAIAVYTALRSYADFGSEEGAAVRDQMAAARAGCSVSTFKRRRNRLLNAGWIDWESGQDMGVVNRYTVHDAPRVGQTELPLDQNDPLGSLTESDIPRASIPRANTDQSPRIVFDVFVEERKRHVAGALDLKPTTKRLRQIKGRLDEGLTLDQASEAARGIFYAENHVRDGWKYSTIDVAFRSLENCERFIRAFRKNGNGAQPSLESGRGAIEAIERGGKNA